MRTAKAPADNMKTPNPSASMKYSAQCSLRLEGALLTHGHRIDWTSVSHSIRSNNGSRRFGDDRSHSRSFVGQLFRDDLDDMAVRIPASKTLVKT